MRPISLIAAALTLAAGHTAIASVTVYTDRAAWLAAVNAAVQTEQFQSLPVQNFTNLVTPTGLVTMTYDRLSSTPGNNPGIVNFGGTWGHVLHFNHQDPTATFETGAPFNSSIGFGAPITAFGADYVQVGVTAGGTPVGAVTLHIGSETVNMQSHVNAAGNGFVGIISTKPFSSASFTFVRSGTIVNDVFQLDALSFGTAAAACYPNCDGSTATPILNVQDFACFLNAFASGDSYANCDGSTAIPVLNVQDFACFLNGFAAGCP
jgi:hypothetical protein